MQFKLFVIDKIKLVLMLENMLDSEVCHLPDSSKQEIYYYWKLMLDDMLGA